MVTASASGEPEFMPARHRGLCVLVGDRDRVRDGRQPVPAQAATWSAARPQARRYVPVVPLVIASRSGAAVTYWNSLFSSARSRRAERDLLSRCYLLANARRVQQPEQQRPVSKVWKHSAGPLRRLRAVLEANLDRCAGGAFGCHLAVGLLTAYAPEDLTEREAQICDLVAADSTNKQIAARRSTA